MVFARSSRPCGVKHAHWFAPWSEAPAEARLPFHPQVNVSRGQLVDVEPVNAAGHAPRRSVRYV
jgi:hypothetical protein